MDDLRGVQQDVQTIKATLTKLEQRLARLEGKPTPPVAAPSTVAAVPHATVSVGTSVKKGNSYTGTRVGLAIFGILLMYLGALSWMFALLGLAMLLLAIFWPTPKHATTASATTPAGQIASTMTAPVVHQPHRPSQFEQDLAKHWFSWVGIISIVVGITLLLNYAFQGYGPIGRVFTGYGAAVMLFGLWAWLRTRYRGFAFVLQSGGWAVVYISTFALHVISGQPVDSPIIAGALLIAVAGVMCFAAIVQRSIALTAGAFFLGYITAFTSSLSTFVTVSLLILAVGAVVVASVKRWQLLVTLAAFATYFVQFGWLTSNQFDPHQLSSLHSTILFFDLVVFGAAHWLIGARNKYEEGLTILGSTINLTGFYFLFQYYVDLTRNPNGWLAPMLIGVVCGLLAVTATYVARRSYLRSVYTAFSIAFITVALGQWLKGDTRIMVWLIEGGAVVSLGLLTRFRTMRIMGYLTTVIGLVTLAAVLMLGEEHFGSTTLDRRLVLGVLGLLIYSTVAMIARLRRTSLGMIERYVPEIMADLAVLIGLTVVAQQLESAWVPAVWVIGAPLAFAYGAWRNSLHARGIAIVIAIISLWYWLTVVSTSTALAGSLDIHSRLLTGIWITLSLFATAWMFRARATRPVTDRWLSTMFGWLTVVTLTLTFGVEIANRWLSVAWGLEGVALYAIGFMGQNTNARRQGLVVMAITIAKVYIYDVQTLATPYRILSFILLGVILLGIGYAYNRWRQRPKQTT